MLKQLFAIIGYTVIGILSAAALLVGGIGMYFVLTEVSPSLFHGPDMSGNAGWAIFGVLAFGIPSAGLLAAGIAGFVFLRNRWRD